MLLNNNDQRDPLLKRGMPHDEDAERALVGGLLAAFEAGDATARELLNIARERLQRGALYSLIHRRVFETMVSLSDQQTSINAVTICADDRARADAPELSIAEVSALSCGVPTAEARAVESYCRVLNEYARRRTLIRLCNNTIACAVRNDQAALEYSVARLRESIAGCEQVEVSSLLSLNSQRPTLGEAALHGLAGEWVRLIEPHTEASVAALISQFLVLFGNVIGRSAHFRAEADNHFTNLFLVIVGLSSKSRKGTSWGRVASLFEGIDAGWRASGRCGLESGEGVVFHVRDGSNSDPGVTDKRLLIVESEFGGPLRVMARPGNTLSPTLRQAWDKGDLEGLTKNSPIRATGAHISIIGHITEYELQQQLNVVETSNGFSNRFLWVCSERSKSLPEGGAFDTVDLQPIISRLREAVEFAKNLDELRRDDEARELWAEVYDELSEGKQGLLGAVTSRGEAQVMRMACCYALLDLSDVITRAHLEAALALWRYCEESAAFIFGDRLGDPVADRILAALKDCVDGLTRSDINNLFKRHKSAPQIDAALRSLKKQGRVRSTLEQTTGRPAERFFAALKGAKKAKEAKEGYEQPNHEGLISHNSLISPPLETESGIPAHYEDWI